VLHAASPLAIGPDLVCHIEYENTPVPQVVERFGAFRVCALTHHDSFSLCAAEFPRLLSAGSQSEALLQLESGRELLAVIPQYGVTLRSL
jgi:hypothetical protein